MTPTSSNNATVNRWPRPLGQCHHPWVVDLPVEGFNFGDRYCPARQPYGDENFEKQSDNHRLRWAGLIVGRQSPRPYTPAGTSERSIYAWRSESIKQVWPRVVVICHEPERSIRAPFLGGFDRRPSLQKSGAASRLRKGAPKGGQDQLWPAPEQTIGNRPQLGVCQSSSNSSSGSLSMASSRLSMSRPTRFAAHTCSPAQSSTTMSALGREA